MRAYHEQFSALGPPGTLQEITQNLTVPLRVGPFTS